MLEMNAAAASKGFLASGPYDCDWWHSKRKQFRKLLHKSGCTTNPEKKFRSSCSSMSLGLRQSAWP